MERAGADRPVSHAQRTPAATHTTETPTTNQHRWIRAQERPKGHTHWSCRTMAARVGVSPATVQRIWCGCRVNPDPLVPTDSVKDLNAKIRAFVDGWNDRAHPFRVDQDRRSNPRKSQPSEDLKGGALNRVWPDTGPTGIV